MLEDTSLIKHTQSSESTLNKYLPYGLTPGWSHYVLLINGVVDLHVDPETEERVTSNGQHVHTFSAHFTHFPTTEVELSMLPIVSQSPVVPESFTFTTGAEDPLVENL